MRPIEKVLCSCGGEPQEEEQTTEEERQHGCGRGCCLVVIRCPKCGTRFLIRLEAPEAE
jgi:hypothetical protein